MADDSSGMNNEGASPKMISEPMGTGVGIMGIKLWLFTCTYDHELQELRDTGNVSMLWSGLRWNQLTSPDHSCCNQPTNQPSRETETVTTFYTQHSTTEWSGQRGACPSTCIPHTHRSAVCAVQVHQLNTVTPCSQTVCACACARVWVCMRACVHVCVCACTCV